MMYENKSQINRIVSHSLKSGNMVSDSVVSIQDNNKSWTFLPNSTPIQNVLFKPLFKIKKMVRRTLYTIKSESTIMYWSAAIMLLFFVGCFVGLLIDDRTLMGVNVWIKPLKFSISIGVYLLTVGYLVTKYPYSRKKKNIINHITAWMLVVEMGIIALQAYRGVQSHYNTSTPFDAILFMAMGVLTGTVVLIMALFIIDTIRLKLKTGKAMQWAILLGWCVIFFGSWVGGQMIAQLSHNIGVASGGAGLPLVNWSTIGGDLRIAHFFGLHGIQIIPFFGFWVSRKWKSSDRKQIIAVTLFALAYALWIGFTFYQAKQGMALIAQ